MENINISELVERLGSDEDAVRKMAVFKLQSNIGDPSFADVFIAEGGLSRLRRLTLTATGNTLAYSLTSFSRLLEVDRGWEFVSQELVERVVELVVLHPLVNILRGAMSILVAVVSHPQQKAATAGRPAQPGSFGFRALKPAIAVHPQFLEMLVSRLSSADHALCANALQLINSLMRDAITNDADSEWPRFIKRLQDLGVIKAVYSLMQDSALQDLAHPLLEFQTLSKVLLRKWRDVPVDLEKQEHRRALKAIHLASNPDRSEKAKESMDSTNDTTKRSTRHHPEKWRRLGFETESPAWEFDAVGFLGMMDLTDYVRKREDGFQKAGFSPLLLLEQSTKSVRQRCPIARASLAVSLVLYEHFEVDKSDTEDAKSYLALESRSNVDKAFKPMLLQWSRLHTAGLQAFFRLWKATGAELDEFDKVTDLIRILVEQVVGQASRTKNVAEVEEELANFGYKRLRELQMELLELTYEDAWGHHLRQVREELRHEALQFVKEQRIRCLLDGTWFPNDFGYARSVSDRKEGGSGPITKHDLKRSVPSSWRSNLSWTPFLKQVYTTPPTLDPLNVILMKAALVDLSIVSSVESNVSKRRSTSVSSTSSASSEKSSAHGSRPSSSSSTSTTSTLKDPSSTHPPRLSTTTSRSNATTTKITIHGRLPAPPATSHSHHHQNPPSTASGKETILLTLHPRTHSTASEWVDGLLMLLNQAPITAETQHLVHLVGTYGLKIRLLNVRFDDAIYAREEPEIPGREGVDEEYFYDVFGGGGNTGAGTGEGVGNDRENGVGVEA
ncbi:MAG: hypothetical protein M4579_002538 [Chaenotheca gracillima]|nr:MAG: hypothetical protein M4579_002538 [Chaenotheca gracillima]